MSHVRFSPEAAISLLRDKAVSLTHADSDKIADCIQRLCAELARAQQRALFDEARAGAPAGAA
ncbi:MAG: hypothetical protein AB7L71_02445 [Vicinamibacterales bacterium]